MACISYGYDTLCSQDLHVDCAATISQNAFVERYRKWCKRPRLRQLLLQLVEELHGLNGSEGLHLCAAQAVQHLPFVESGEADLRLLLPRCVSL